LLEVQDREVPIATGLDGGVEIYLNLARRVKVRGPDQVWIADITYIRLKGEFVYLGITG
jgi:putative transposase